MLVLDAPVGFDPGAPFDCLLNTATDSPTSPPARTASGAEPYDVVILFCADMAALRTGFDRAAGAHEPAGMVWVCWPKRSSGVRTDLSDGVVRQYGLDHGQVDVKVAAIDATWSGLKFVTRLRNR